MSGVMDRAEALGQVLAHTDEYQALTRAINAANDDRELVEGRNRLVALEQELAAEIQAGKKPEQEKAEEYESEAMKLQANPAYQRLVAAQENFDKLMAKVNQTIAKGMEQGAGSRIILPT